MKKMFSTPGRAVVSTLCIVAIVLALLIGVGAAAFSRGYTTGRAADRNIPTTAAPTSESVSGTAPTAQGATTSEPVSGTAPTAQGATTSEPVSGTAPAAQAATTSESVSGTAPAAQGAPAEQITLEEAKGLALADAGLAEENVSFTKMKLDYDHGRAYYDIEFFTADSEYDYEIDTYTGAVAEKSMEARSGKSPASPDAGSATGEYIGADKAEEIALTHAGVDRADAWFVKSQLDRDDGRMEYEVEFFSGGVEYDYAIDALTGDVLEYDTDYN